MQKHTKKMIAPIVITVLVIAYFLFYFTQLMSAVDSTALKLLLGIRPAALGAAMISVLIQRIREIKGGEEDDLGKY